MTFLASRTGGRLVLKGLLRRRLRVPTHALEEAEEILAAQKACRLVTGKMGREKGGQRCFDCPQKGHLSSELFLLKG